MELVTAHIWVDDRLQEVDYYRAIGQGGRAVLVKVHKSERHCQCPGRQALEHQRRGTRDLRSA